MRLAKTSKFEALEGFRRPWGAAGCVCNASKVLGLFQDLFGTLRSQRVRSDRPSQSLGSVGSLLQTNNITDTKRIIDPRLCIWQNPRIVILPCGLGRQWGCEKPNSGLGLGFVDARVTWEQKKVHLLVSRGLYIVRVA